MLLFKVIYSTGIMVLTGGMMIFTNRWKMLALFLLIIATADFCQSKAFSEAEKARDKRFYSHDQSVGLRQTYDSQGNAEHWMKGKFYQPEVDGQPIYVPALDQPGSYNEFLDAYYKAYTPAWNLVTPAPSTYKAKSTYKTPEKAAGKGTYDEKDGIKYELPIPKETELTVDMETSEDYDAPEIVDETIMTEFSNRNSDQVTSEDYDALDYDDPEIDEFENNSDYVTPEPKDLDEFKDPVFSESLKKADLPQTKPGSYNLYEEPVIVETVKQKSKTNSVKGDSYKKPSTPKTNPQLQYTEDKNPVVIKTVKQKPKTNVANKDFSKPSVSKPQFENDYVKPVIKVKQKPKVNNAKKDYAKPTMPKTKPQLEKTDDYEIPVVIKTVKQKPKTSAAKEDSYKPGMLRTKPQPEKADDYEMPVVIKTVKQKPKTNTAKEDSYKPSMSNTKPQLENEDYEKPVVIRPTIKPNKKVTNPSRYGDGTSQASRGKSKGKRRKQYLTSNKPRTGEEAIDMDTKSVEIPDELNKNLQSYPPLNIETKRKVGVKTDSKNKPLETKEKAEETDQKYKPVKTAPLKSNSKNKPITTNPENKPVKTKEKVVIKTDSRYPSVKTKGEVTVQSYPNDKPIKEKVAEKYDAQEREEKETLKRQLNDQNEDSEESDMSHTENPLNKPDLADGLYVSKSEFSENKFANSDEPTTLENIQNSESSKNSAVTESDSTSNSPNDFRGLSSMNSNIWSMLFNPNAEQNRLKLKRCITRSNETGFCTYIQNCEVPHIATSLEQLLNNACVIDDIFIGVCCPEFPVQTVKVHWDQTSSDFDNQIEDEFGHNTEDCGIRSNEATEAQSWPWKAPLVSMSNGKIFCGGVVVSEDHILTAAHCTTKIPKNQILVRLGQYDDTSGDDYAVVEIKRHAQYNPRTMHNDIALLKLGRRIMNDAHIGIVCLPDEDGKNNHDGETATLLGWRGIFGTKSRDPEFLEVISNNECASKLGMKLPSTSLCTETRKETERTCNADSGAPLVIQEDGKYEVIGILSWNRNDCDRRFPSTFSRVSSYIGWIKNHIA